MLESRPVTEWLTAWSRGDDASAEPLMESVYDELRRIADRSLNDEREGHTLQPTALVHEAYLRLGEQRSVEWQSRNHFFAIAARMMRRILVDHARRHHRQKRNGGQ